MVMCGGFNRNANKGRYGGSFGGRGRGGKYLNIHQKKLELISRKKIKLM